MKKLLALILALTLASAMSVADAAFADAAESEHIAAVEVLSALHVIAGKEENRFDPDGEVKRSEMAKMVAVLKFGDSNFSAFTGSKVDLYDVDDHWAEAYIKFCVSQKIVSGRGNGRFDPDADVTAAEAAKMMLVAIGYDAGIQGYNSNKWTENVVRDAQANHFFKGLSVEANQSLTRDQAAQLLCNAARAECVEVNAAWSDRDGESGSRYNKLGVNLLGETFGVVEEEGYIVASDLKRSGVHSGDYEINFYSTDTYAALTAAGSDAADAAAGSYKTFYTGQDHSDVLGQTVALLWSDADRSGSYSFDMDAVLGFVPGYDDAATGLIARSAFSRETDRRIEANGTVYELEDGDIWHVTADGASSYMSGAAASAVPVPDLRDQTLDQSSVVLRNSYDFVRLVDRDGNNKYDLVIVYDVEPYYVSYVDGARFTVGAETVEKSGCVVADTLAAKDYVVKRFNFTYGAPQYIVLERQTAEATAKDRDSRPNKTQLNGEWIADAPAALNGGLTALSLGQIYDYYAYNGVLVHAVRSTGAAGYALVTGSAITVSADGGNCTQYTIWDGVRNRTVIDRNNMDAAKITKFTVVAYSSIDSDGSIRNASFAKSSDSADVGFANTPAVTTAGKMGSAALSGFEKDSNGNYVLTLCANGAVVGATFSTDSRTVYLRINSAASEADEIGVAGEPEIRLADEVYGQLIDNVIVANDPSVAGRARVVVFDVSNRLATGAASAASVTVSGSGAYGHASAGEHGLQPAAGAR